MQQRQKTDYAERPPQYEVRRANGIAFVTLTENAQEIVEDDRTHWEADAYTIAVLDSSLIESRVAMDFETWIEWAKRIDRDETARVIKARRDTLIAETDFYMRDDYPASVEYKREIAEYSQALRDIPEQAGFPYAVVWPIKPLPPAKQAQNLTRECVDNLQAAFDALIGGDA